MGTDLSKNDEDIVRSKPLSHAVFRAQTGADTDDPGEIQKPDVDQAYPALASGTLRPGLH